MRRLMLITAVLLLAGCASIQRSEENPHPRLADPAAGGDAYDAVLVTADEDAGQGGIVDNEFFGGNNPPINMEAASRRPPPVTEDGEIVLNFEGESIQSVVHTILGEVLQETFVIGPGVSGQVTFATSKPVSRAQLMPILELLLRWNGATLVFHEGRYHVLPVSEAIPGHLVPRIGPAAQARGFEVRAVPLEFISATEMARILEPYARPNAIVNVDPARGMIFIAGTREELANYLQTVEIFDVDWLAGMSVGIYPLSTVDVNSIITELGAIFGDEAQGPLSGMFRFVPMERLGSIMVITPRKEYLAKAAGWIERLDRGAAGSGSQLYVYRVKNLEAQVLANYLSQLFSGSAVGGDQQRRTNLAPGLEPVTRSSVGEFNNNRETANTRGLQASSQGQGQRGSGTASIQAADGTEIRITSVVETNSLLIQATQSQFASIEAAMQRIDEEPLQVLIESQVMDVELNEELTYGVNWYLTNNAANLPEGIGPDSGRVLDTLEFGSGSSRTGGFNIVGTLTDAFNGGNGFVAATIAALDSVTDVRSVSAPSLVVRNNSTATITVGTQVPVQSSSISTGNNNVISSAQYVSTGVTLNVTPRINPGGLVYLDISQEVTRPGARDPDISTSGNPPISNKSVSSQVAVQSGQTIFLGGLISESSDQGTSGVPYLNRIPIVGGLFGTKSQASSRSETIVMITPTVLENANDLKTITDDLRDEFIDVPPIRISTIQ